MFIETECLQRLSSLQRSETLGPGRVHFAPLERGSSIDNFSINISPLCGEGRTLLEL